MAESKRQLLSIGVFFIIIVAAILLYAAQVIKDWTLIFPIIFVLSGCWALILTAMRSSSPQKYERGAFSTMGLGLLHDCPWRSLVPVRVQRIVLSGFILLFSALWQ